MKLTTHHGMASDLCALHQFLAGPVAHLEAPVDWVVGLGHFDLGIPRLCGALHLQGLARHIAFAGGLGAGTADLGQPEADAFLAELERTFPRIDLADVVLENRSTNTGENFRFLSAELARRAPELCRGGQPKSALIIATPIRLRRAILTARKQWPGTELHSLAPVRDWRDDQALYQTKGLSLPRQMLEEIKRLQTYPAQGWIESCNIPADIDTHAKCVSEALQTGQLI